MTDLRSVAMYGGNMAYTEISQQLVNGGEAVQQEFGQLTRDNFIDHEARILNNETVVNVFRPYSWDFYGLARAGDGQAYDRVAFNTTVLSGRVMAHIAGYSGTLTADISFKRGVASFVSIFSVLPSVAFGDGDFAISTNGVLTSDVINNGLQTGDILRVDIDGVQNGVEGFRVYMDFERKA